MPGKGNSYRVGSLFAGIGGFDLGFERAGFEVAWCVEWDRNARKVLAARFPRAEIYGDIREVDASALQPVDVICGGFPCQDLSVAGKRAGLAGERSGLFHDAMRIVRRLGPSFIVFENVPGLLSSNRGLDFATVLREVGEGWDCAEVAWRVLDSQFFGVAQRRRRVFIVAVRDPRVGCAEEILALASSGGGHPPAKREARQGSSSDASRCADGGRWWDGKDTAASLTTRCHNQFMPDKGNFAAVIKCFRVGSFGGYQEGIGTLRREGGDVGGGSETLALLPSMVVRRLTPIECERLQGFPDGWTDVGTPEKPTADSHRFKQLGNAVTVNVAEWLAKNVAMQFEKREFPNARCHRGAAARH